MAFMSIFMTFMIFMIFIMFIRMLFLIVKKIGMTLLAKKMNIDNYALLWIPGLGALYEGKLINSFLNYGKKFEIGYFIVIMIVRIMWLGYFFLGFQYNEPLFDILDSIISHIASTIMLMNTAFRIMTVRKSGYNLFISIIISLFLSPFWCFFASEKIKKHS